MSAGRNYSGSPTGAPRPYPIKRTSYTAEDFWARVEIRDGDECWPWLAGHHPDGRGTLAWRGRRRFAYRIAWELAHGEPPPDDLLVCHSCDNPRCVRPDHLFVGTVADNNRDMFSKGRHPGVPHPVGEAHFAVTTPDRVVRQIRERSAQGEPLRVLARQYGVTYGRAWSWVRGKGRVSAGGPILPTRVGR